MQQELANLIRVLPAHKIEAAQDVLQEYYREIEVEYILERIRYYLNTVEGQSYVLLRGFFRGKTLMGQKLQRKSYTPKGRRYAKICK